jgi:Family of unknown function (DUF6339)
MPDRALEIFTEPFVAVLRARIFEHLSFYAAADPWALSINYAGQKTITTKIRLSEAFNLAPPTDSGRNNDAQNAAILHRLLPDLTRAQATDERLWARLTHCECWQYMRLRWPIERFEDDEKAKRFIKSRYFLEQAQGRSLLRNGLARLWWSAHLTFDRQRDNPYELTEILLSRLDIAATVLERSLGRSPAVLTGFLDFLRLNGQRLLTGGDRSRAEIRALAKALNLYGGLNLLDTHSEESIISFLSARLDELTASPAEEAEAAATQ